MQQYARARYLHNFGSQGLTELRFRDSATPGPIFQRYVEDYADHFEIRSPTRLGGRVTGLAPRANRAAGWTVSIEEEGGGMLHFVACPSSWSVPPGCGYSFIISPYRSPCSLFRAKRSPAFLNNESWVYWPTQMRTRVR